jgi:hypothetical protein
MHITVTLGLAHDPCSILVPAANKAASIWCVLSNLNMHRPGPHQELVRMELIKLLEVRQRACTKRGIIQCLLLQRFLWLIPTSRHSGHSHEEVQCKCFRLGGHPELDTLSSTSRSTEVH